jgi:hypothetical protein
MKVLVKFVVLSIILAFCVPASGDILIYKKKLKCWDAYNPGGDLWDVVNSRVKGFLVLEVNYNPDGTLAEIVGSTQIDYWWERGEGKLYEVFEHNFDIIRITDNRSVVWVFVEQDIGDGDIDFVMLKGKVRETSIGTATDEEVPKRIDGDELFYYDNGDWLVTCRWSLRFYKRWTQWSNEDEDDLFGAVNNIEAWLENKGYQRD